MGDRVLMQVFQNHADGSVEVGPAVYGHWSGSDAGAICANLQLRMIGRPQDVSYTSARLVQEMVKGDDGNTGFGVWNQVDLLTKEDSHGDAGVVLIDASGPQLSFQVMGGYLKLNEHGLPIEG